MEYVLKHLERTSPYRVACQSKETPIGGSWRDDHWDRSWDGRKKMGHKRSAEECITHIRSQDNAKVSKWRIHRCTSGRPNPLAVPAKKESKRAPTTWKGDSPFFHFCPTPRSWRNQRQQSKLRRESESEIILRKQTLKSALLPHFRTLSQGSGRCYGNGRSSELDLGSKIWFKLCWVF